MALSARFTRRKVDEYLSPDQKAPFLSLRIKGNCRPARFNGVGARKRAHYSLANAGSKVIAVIKVQNKRSHITFETYQAVAQERCGARNLGGLIPPRFASRSARQWGVVRDKQYALGIQALNIKTLGGYPNTEDDIEPSYDIFATSSVVDLSGDDVNKDLYRGDTARQTDFGSVLQAYTRDRSKTRIIENWGHKKYVAPAF